MIKGLLTKYREIIVYVIFGVLTTIVAWVSFKLFDVILGEKLYLVSNIISWIFAVAFAYITNKLWVFDSKSWKADVIKKEIPEFVSARLLTLGIEELGLWIMLSLCGMQKLSITLLSSFTINGNMIAKILMSFIVVVLNYFFSKFLIFKRKGKKANENN